MTLVPIKIQKRETYWFMTQMQPSLQKAVASCYNLIIIVVVGICIGKVIVNSKQVIVSKIKRTVNIRISDDSNVILK